MNRIIGCFSVLLVIFILNLNCAPEDNLTEYERNDPYPQYRLFNLLDDYPALKEPFSNMDQFEFNNRLNNMVNNNIDESQIFFRLIEDVVNHPKHPLTDSLAILRNILWRVINQDSIDTESEDETRAGTDDYFVNLADFLDRISESDMSLSADILALGRKSLDYINDNYSGIELEDEMTQLIDDMEKGSEDEDEAPSAVNLQELIAKATIQGNENMWLDPDKKLRLNSNEINFEKDTDTGIGNSASGIEALLSGAAEITGDETVKEYLFNILRDYGNISTSDVNGKKIGVIFKELFENVEDYMTKGGAVYGDGETENLYRKDGDRYLNNELGTTLSELMPVLTDLLIKGGRESSVIAGDTYLFDLLARGFNTMDISEETLNKLEDCLYKFVRYDDKCRDRLLDPESSNFSALDKLLWVLGLVSDYGWSPKIIEENPFVPDPYDSHGRVQGTPTHGILTLNDAFYAITSLPAPEMTQQVVDKLMAIVTGGLLPGLPSWFYDSMELVLGFGIGDIVDYIGAALLDLEVNVYGLAFDNPRGDLLHRSAFPFKASDIQHGELPFYLPTGGLGLSAIAGREMVGDLGTPWGGRHFTGVDLPFDFPSGGDGTFIQYCKDGLGTHDAGEWIMGFLARVCWKGQGPYYCKNRLAGQSETQDIGGYTYHVYYAPNGKPAVWVNKVNPADSSTWIYREPRNGFDDSDSYICEYKSRHNYDYYMIRVPDRNDQMHYHPLTEAGYRNRDPANKVFALGNNYEPDDPYDKASTDPNTDAGTITITEMVPGTMALSNGTEITVTNADRECETHEEAMFKNLQWLLYEKRFLLGFPIFLGVNPPTILGMIELQFNCGAWVIIQGNGVLGLLTASKCLGENNPLSVTGIADGNGKWNLMSKIYPNPPAGAADPTSCYGDINADSPFLGDSKLTIFTQGGNGRVKLLGYDLFYIHSLMDPKLLYDNLLGPAHLLLPYIINNIDVFRTLLFINQEAYYNIYDIPSVACGPVSTKWEALGWPSEENPYWEDRNVLTPILGVLMGVIHDNAKLSSDINDKTVYPKNILAYRTVLKGLVPILCKPLIEYQVKGQEPIDCWKPLMNPAAEVIPVHIDSTIIQSPCMIPGPYLDSVNYPPTTESNYENQRYWMTEAAARSVPVFKRTLFSMLADSDPVNGKRCDGYLALPFGFGNNILSLFRELGSGKFDDPADADPNDYRTWGARRKIFYGLEQILTSVKSSKSSAELIDKKYLVGELDSLSKREFMFAENGTRPQDILLDNIIEDLVGYDATLTSKGKGIANFPDSKTAEDWDEYISGFNDSGEFVSNNGTTGGKYNLVDNLINLMDELLGSVEVTDQDAAALRHTLGVVFSMYNKSTGEWEYPNDLDTLTMDELPYLMRIFQGNYEEFLAIVIAMLKEDGFLEFLMTTLRAPSFTSEDVLTQLYDFLGDDVISRYDSSLWADLAAMLTGFADMMESGEPGWPDELFNSSNDVLESADPFEGLGELLSF